MITLVASNARQAELAALQLGLGPRQWRLANTIEQLQGITAEGIIMVSPVLGTGRELLGYYEARDYARFLAVRDSVTLTYVTT